MTLALIMPVFTSCSEETPVVNDQNEQKDTTEDKTPTNSALLMKKWLVDKAYVDGTTPDVSSKGLKIEFEDAGVYTLFLKTGSTNKGTWKFIENETKIDIDEGGQWHQTWTIQELSDSMLDVKFVSPFTGQNAQWIMK
jgi:hypothetical protein